MVSPGRDEPDHEPVAPPRHRLDPGEALGDLQREGVQEGAGEADPGGEEGEAHPDDRVVAEGQGQGTKMSTNGIASSHMPKAAPKNEKKVITVE